MVLIYLLMKYAGNLVMAENDKAILRYVQPPNMTPQQNADDLISKSCNVADVYDMSTLNVEFIEDVNASSRHGLCYCCS